MARTINKGDYLIHAVYLTLYGIVKYIPSPIGDILRKMVLRLFGCKMGAKCRIYEGVTIWYPYRLHLGDRVTLNEWVYLSAFDGLSIGTGCSIGHRTSILTSDHTIKVGTPIKDQPLKSSTSTIGDDVFIGANVTILMGISIGSGGIIGAGSVVTKSVQENQIVAGNPATFIKNRPL